MNTTLDRGADVSDTQALLLRLPRLIVGFAIVSTHRRAPIVGLSWDRHGCGPDSPPLLTVTVSWRGKELARYYHLRRADSDREWEGTLRGVRVHLREVSR